MCNVHLIFSLCDKVFGGRGYDKSWFMPCFYLVFYDVFYIWLFVFYQVLSSTTSITLNSEEIKIQSAHYKAAGINIYNMTHKPNKDPKVKRYFLLLKFFKFRIFLFGTRLWWILTDASWISMIFLRLLTKSMNFLVKFLKS